jgi:hypothetical protein
MQIGPSSEESAGDIVAAARSLVIDVPLTAMQLQFGVSDGNFGDNSGGTLSGFRHSKNDVTGTRHRRPAFHGPLFLTLPTSFATCQQRNAAMNRLRASAQN